jgi:hypothetical protein
MGSAAITRAGGLNKEAMATELDGHWTGKMVIRPCLTFLFTVSCNDYGRMDGRTG